MSRFGLATVVFANALNGRDLLPEWTRLRASCLAALLTVAPGAAVAVGPTHVATIERSVWPDPIATPAEFDHASRFELLQLTAVYSHLRLDTPGEVAQFTGIREPAMPHVRKWRQTLQAVLLANYRAAAQHCDSIDITCRRLSGWTQLQQLAVASGTLRTAPRYAAWNEASQRFYLSYLYEQARLAALFGRITSEIETLGADEVNGVHFPDRSILLTFDDGPSADGETARVTGVLRSLNLHGEFFTLGARMEQRLAQEGRRHMEQLYAGECVGSHGFTHVPHAHLATWRDSLTRTQAVLTAAGLIAPGQMPDFRPPYGQRNTAIANFVGAAGAHVVLWNIDSQDWNEKLSAAQIRDRVITLLLVWRHGIVLFHDVHHKAAPILPQLARFMAATGIRATDCHAVPMASENALAAP